MRSPRFWLPWLCVLFAATTSVVTWSIARAQQDRQVPVSSLLPADTVVYVGWDGTQAQRDAYEQTAAYESLHESGLMEFFQKLAGLTKVIPESEQGGPEAKQLIAALQHVAKSGFSLSVSLPGGIGGPPLPRGTVVLHDAAGLEAGLTALAKRAAAEEGVELQSRTVQGRKVTSVPIPDSPGVEVGWWAEGQHLLVAVGINAVQGSLAVVTEDAPDITTNPLWKKYRRQDDGLAVTAAGWVDFKPLRNTFGQMPLPPTPDGRQIRVNQVLEVLGLDTLDAIAFRCGYKGRANWSETYVEAPAPRRGLLAFADQESFTLDDLPPLPATAAGFAASSVDWAKVWDDGLELARSLASFGPPDAAAQMEGVVDQLPALVGFDPKADLLEPLGNVSVAYAEPDQSFFGFGFGFACQVDDAEKLQQTLDKLAQRVQQQVEPKQFAVRKTSKHGREIATLEIGGGFANPAYVIDDGWIYFGLTPQAVEVALLRTDGRLPRWEPDEEYQTALDTLPKEFTSIVVTDPRPGVKTLMGLAPTLMGFVQGAIRQSGELPPDFEMPVTVADLPPAELVARPLFPNVAVCTVDDRGIKWTSRSSLPAIPLLTGGSSAVTVPVLIALLLPAVQQAREAARRSASKNNLKQIGLALHNYHDTHSHMPPGTIPNEDLKPKERLSWMVDVLPYVEQAALREQFDDDKAWNAEANRRSARTELSIFLHPSQSRTQTDDGYAMTHYVGIAGVGKDAPTLAVDHERAGAFGYDRKLRFAHVRDGLSNTMGVAEASQDFGPWAAGGSATIRALTKKPYVNGPDGIGSHSPDGFNALNLDGSVRFLSKDIDPKVLEAMSTINGGEVVPRF